MLNIKQYASQTYAQQQNIYIQGYLAPKTHHHNQFFSPSFTYDYFQAQNIFNKKKSKSTLNKQKRQLKLQINHISPGPCMYFKQNQKKQEKQNKRINKSSSAYIVDNKFPGVGKYNILTQNDYSINKFSKFKKAIRLSYCQADLNKGIQVPGPGQYDIRIANFGKKYLKNKKKSLSQHKVIKKQIQQVKRVYSHGKIKNKPLITRSFKMVLPYKQTDSKMKQKLQILKKKKEQQKMLCPVKYSVQIQWQRYVKNKKMKNILSLCSKPNSPSVYY